MWPADAVLLVQALIVLFIVGGRVAIWVGASLRRQWGHQPPFRRVNLGAIGAVVVAFPVLGTACPRTSLKDRFAPARRAGGLLPALAHRSELLRLAGVFMLRDMSC